MKRITAQFFSFAATLTLAACMVGPDYKPPQVEAPTAYKEAGNWLPAKPNDAIDRGAWWSIYNDPVLDGFEKQIDISNQNLKAAEAQWREARAVVEESRAQLFPTISTSGSGTREGGGTVKGGPVNIYDLSAGASWVPDLWGRIRRTIESDIANAQASAADLALARLSAQAELATDYFTMRAQDELKYLLDTTAANDRKALKIVKNQYEVGVAAKADVLTAQTQLESVEAQAINAGVLRAQLEHAIAVLTGKPPAEVTIAAQPLAQKIPVVPTGVPSELLERRPDIAASERQMGAANAQIGVAIAAYFPDLTLSASYGFTGNMLSHLIQAPNSLWSFGPSLAETVFDAGLRDAQVEAARATYDQNVATYRQTVLTGFQQVEDQLAALRILEQQAKVEKQVVADAHKSEELVLNQYKAGTVPYSSVLTAQITTLGNEQTSLTVRENRFIASVALIEALGGGWDVSQLGSSDAPAPPPPDTKETPVATPTTTEATPHTISNINPAQSQ
jgi:NodT family efflux transporter outer membrane factor (OMF) lipoprotein